jgi:hypothetical protein
MTLREQVYLKFDGKCAYSGTKLKDDWQMDHIIPVSDFGSTDGENLLPVQRILNHYKRAYSLEEFRTWLLGELHLRLKKLPKNPRADRTIRHKEYLLEVAELFGITEDKPFDQVFYFEKIKEQK